MKSCIVFPAFMLTLMLLCYTAYRYDAREAAKAASLSQPSELDRKPGAPFSKVSRAGSKLRGYYRITIFTPKPHKYVTFEYRTNPDGSIYFKEGSTFHTVTPPFTVEEFYAAPGW